MVPGHDLGAYLQNFAAEYGRKYGGAGFASAMNFATQMPRVMESIEGKIIYSASDIAADVDRIYNMLKPPGPVTV